MLLSDLDIKKEIEDGNISIEGLSELYIGPCSVDMHLDNNAVIAGKKFGETHSTNPIINVTDPESTKEYFTDYNDWSEIKIFPGEFYIMSTVEAITLPDNIAAFVQGRSSLARLGVNIHAAGFVDPGFSGNITLEVTNFTSIPIIIPKNTRICQLVFQYTKTSCEVPYGKKKDSKYQNQQGPTQTKISEDYEN